jgi:NADPH:quinone reductase-like Zn-dependent oxidoreductase
MLAEYRVLPATGLVPIPDHLSYAEGATLPCAGVTAWNALHVVPTGPGEAVVIQGTGGVSIFALQFAKMRGARVLGTSSSDEKIERARSLGLDGGCNYCSSPDWTKWVLDQTGNRGADLIVEVGGGTLHQSLQAVAIGGTVAQIGVLSQSTQPITIAALLHRQVRVQGIYVGSRAHFEAMNRAITANLMRPVVGHYFAFGDVQKAFRAMETGAHFGKIVVQVVA